MYSVVGCSNCDALWVVEDRPKTTGCPRCGTRHQFDRLKRFTETDDEGDARQVRSTLLAERSGHGEAFSDLGSYHELSAEVGRDVVSDHEYLGAAGLDVAEIEETGERATSSHSGKSGSRLSVVKAALREHDAPTRSSVFAYAAARGIPEDVTRQILERLVREGEVTEDGKHYRLL